MKNLLFILAALLITIQSCKKDDDPGTSSGLGTTGPAIQLPPPGFSFPHIYTQQGGSDEFRMWINGVDVSSKYKPEDIFEQAQLLPPAFTITLTDQHAIEFIDLTGANKPSVGKYFFSRDTLFIIDPDFPDTFPFAKGNFSAFTVSMCEYKVSKKLRDGMSGYRSYGDFEFSATTYQKLLEFAALRNMSDPDTMAYHNQSATFK